MNGLPSVTSHTCKHMAYGCLHALIAVMKQGMYYSLRSYLLSLSVCVVFLSMAKRHDYLVVVSYILTDRVIKSPAQDLCVKIIIYHDIPTQFHLINIQKMYEK